MSNPNNRENKNIEDDLSSYYSERDAHEDHEIGIDYEENVHQQLIKQFMDSIGSVKEQFEKAEERAEQRMKRSREIRNTKKLKRCPSSEDTKMPPTITTFNQKSQSEESDQESLSSDFFMEYKNVEKLLGIPHEEESNSIASEDLMPLSGSETSEYVVVDVITTVKPGKKSGKKTGNQKVLSIINLNEGRKQFYTQYREYKRKKFDSMQTKLIRPTGTQQRSALQKIVLEEMGYTKVPFGVHHKFPKTGNATAIKLEKEIWNIASHTFNTDLLANGYKQRVTYNKDFNMNQCFGAYCPSCHQGPCLYERNQPLLLRICDHKPDNYEKRVLAYRFFCNLLFLELLHYRIPLCIRTKVRALYPSDDGFYSEENTLPPIPDFTNTARKLDFDEGNFKVGGEKYNEDAWNGWW